MTQTPDVLSPRPGEALPASLAPMRPAPAAEPFDSPDHLFEAAWNGVRALAFIEGGKLRLQGRDLKPITSQYPDLEVLPGLVTGDGVVLDGEIVALDSQGRPDFPRLQARLRRQEHSEEGRVARLTPVTYIAFDILYWEHRPLLQDPLLRRKYVLQEVARARPPLRVSEWMEDAGVSFFQAAERLGLDGMMARHKRGIYLPGKRSTDWLEVKVARSGLVAIGGYAFGGGKRREPFASLLLGAYEGDRLVYAGSVSGGFSEAARKEVYERLAPLHTDACPFAEPPAHIQRFIYWCRPELACQVKYGDLTQDRRLRFPLFVALRPDVSPRDCALEDLAPPSVEA